MSNSLTFTPIVNLIIQYQPITTLSLIKKLVEQGADIRDSDNLALRVATTFADLECVEYLIQLGADIFVNDNEPLLNAIQHNLEITQYLISKGANPYSCPDWQLGGYPTSSASKGNLPLLKYLIEELKLPHNMNNDAPFRYACMHDKINTIEYLYTLGVNLENDNNSAFNFACENNSLEAIHFLIDKKINIKNDLQSIISTIILKDNFHILPLILDNLITKQELKPYLNEQCYSYLHYYEIESNICQKHMIKKKKI